MAPSAPTSAPAPPARTPRRGLITLIQIGSLLATGWIVWSAALIPKLRRQSLGSLIIEVVGYTILAWAFSALAALSLYATIPPEERADMMPQVRRTAATAVWFGPALILLTAFSPASLLAALVLVVYASRLLYAQWLPSGRDAAVRVYTARVPGDFAECALPEAFVWRERLPALGVAFCLQAGALAIAVHYPLLGAAWLCAGTALLTVFSMASGAADAGKPPTLPKSIVGILATVVLASLLTLGQGGTGGLANTSSAPGLWPGAPPVRRPSLVETARAVLREVFYGEAPGEPGGGSPPPAHRPQDVAGTGVDGGFPGVILWPEVKPVTMLVAPLPATGSNPFQGRPAQPLSIPFDGEYWMFRWPWAHPPATSYRTRGTPTNMGFSSTDHTPLQMEAHQKLETPIDLRCCSRIQLAVVNADHYPGTLALELVLLNTEPPVPVSQSLGTAVVASKPDLSRDPVAPLREMLDFTVPAEPAIDQFTELKVIFRRARVRIDKSAKLSIERFVLIPR